MKRRFTLILGALCAITVSAAFATAAEIGQIVRQAVDELQPLAQVQAEVRISDDIPSAARTGGKVDISRTQLAGLLRGLSSKQQDFAVKFIVAHELAHLLQYQSYNIAGTYAKARWTQVFEAQADILAGRWVGKALYTKDTIANGLSASVAEAIDAALQIFFESGSERFALGTHPSHEGRRTAVRTGMVSAAVDAYLAAARSGGVNNTTKIWLKELARNTASAIPFLSSQTHPDFDLEWSLKLSQAIVHSDPRVASNLEATFLDGGFNPNPSHASAKHEVRLENKGTNILHVYWEPALVFVSRKDPEDSLQWRRMPLHRSVREVTLAPEESTTVFVNYNWYELGQKNLLPNEAPSMMPSLKSPPADDALWFVVCEGDDTPPAGPTQFDITSSYANQSTALLENALADMRGAATLNDPKEWAVTPLYYWEKYDFEPYYRLRIGFEGGEVCGYHQTTGLWRIQAKRPFRKDSKAARDFFQKAKATLDSMQPALNRLKAETDQSQWRAPEEGLVVTARLSAHDTRDAETTKKVQVFDVIIEFRPDKPAHKPAS